MSDYYEEDFHGDGNDFDYKRFRDPGGRSSLHPGKRTQSCPTCERKNMLTKRDVDKGYQCDRCADMQERGY